MTADGNHETPCDRERQRHKGARGRITDTDREIDRQPQTYIEEHRQTNRQTDPPPAFQRRPPGLAPSRRRFLTLTPPWKEETGEAEVTGEISAKVEDFPEEEVKSEALPKVEVFTEEEVKSEALPKVEVFTEVEVFGMVEVEVLPKVEVFTEVEVFGEVEVEVLPKVEVFAEVEGIGEVEVFEEAEIFAEVEGIGEVEVVAVPTEE